MQAPNDTPAVRRAYDVLRKAANEKSYLDADAREDLLERLAKLIQKHADDIVAAINDDFGNRVAFESRSADVVIPLDAARHARRHVREWMQRRTVPSHPLFTPSHAFIEPLPLGVVAIIAPWNYPVNLALAPLAAAFAAGNRVLIKPSELTPKTSALLARTVSDFFRPEECIVVQGGPEIAREVTSLPFDHILFTGSTNVGRLVAKAAAENLVPLTLELGGKSPALVHESYSLERAAERIGIGKTYNGGQTCIAPDYAMVPKAKLDAFVEKLKAQIIKQHPNGQAFTSMATEKGLKRMEALLADAKAKGAKVTETFQAAAGSRAFAPVILTDVKDDMLVMQEEIFGPILPVESYTSIDEAIARINARPRPLSFYYFDDDQDRVDGVLRRVTCGGVCVNDTLVHFAQEELPFGGVGPSGMGAYHGARGFETFSHFRSVLVASRVSPAYNLLKPPFSAMVEKSVGFLIHGLKGLTKKS
ncbi:MAG: aldehyde dehydrogenase family protein [Myxococcota bacterium]